MGRRGRAGDPDYGFCRGLLFHAAAWPVDHLQIRNAEAISDSVLQNDPDHHEPERGCPVRLVYAGNKVGNYLLTKGAPHRYPRRLIVSTRKWDMDSFSIHGVLDR